MPSLRPPSADRGFRRDVRAPRIRPPKGACDAHMHIVGPLAKYPFAAVRSLSPPEATWDDYMSLAAKLGIDRCVIVQPSFFGSDNACTLDAVERSGGRARAVVVIEPDTSQHELAEMHARGARGVRAQMVAKGGLGFDALETVAARIAPLGWHLLYLDTRHLAELAERLLRLPVPLVFDHMANVDESVSVNDPGFRALVDLVAAGQAWVKLSAAFGPPSAQRARLLAQANPDRVLWGTDWPHVSYRGEAPDDGALLDALADWIPDDESRYKALVTNPDRLYFSAGDTP